MKKLCSSKITVFFIAFGLIITAFLCGLDQFTKFLAQSRLRGSEGFSVISGVLELRYVENRGIAWGMLQGKIPLFLVFPVSHPLLRA